MVAAGRRLAEAVGADADAPVTGTEGRRAPRDRAGGGAGPALGLPGASWSRSPGATWPAPSPRAGHRGARRPGGLRAAGRPGGGRGRAARGRRTLPARRHRDGQDRRTRAQLRLRRRRDLRRRTARRRTRSRTPPSTPRPGWPARPCGSAGRSPGRSMPRCGRRARTARWSAPLASHEAYYRRWASTWEFQALLKARPVAGRPELGPRYRRGHRAAGLEGGRTAGLRRRRAGHAPTGGRAHPGRARRPRAQARPGGLRDVEFAVQLLQLVHGRGDESLRVRGHAARARALRDGGYVGRDDAVSLADAYVFLRAAEHRLQLRRLRRTHLLPDDRPATALARPRHGLPPGRARRRPRGVGGTSGRCTRARSAGCTRSSSTVRCWRLWPACPPRVCGSPRTRRGRAAGRARFRRPGAALRHIESLTAGLSRRATLQRALLPVLLGLSPTRPIPDGGLLAYRQVSDALGRTPWYLRLLRDEGAVASRLALPARHQPLRRRACWAAHPRRCGMLADDDELLPRDRAEIGATMREVAARVRTIRPRRSRRCAACVGRNCCAPPSPTCSAAATSTTVCQALSATSPRPRWMPRWRSRCGVAARSRPPELPLRFAVIAHGTAGRRGDRLRLGRRRHVRLRPLAGSSAEDAATESAARGRRAAARAAVRAVVDRPAAGYRRRPAPGGPQRPAGALARVVRASTTRAGRRPGRHRRCCGPGSRAGDAELGARFVALIDPIRYPAGGLAAADLVEIRRIKARVDDRAATARRRPDHPHQAGSRRPGRHRVDRAIAAARATGTRLPGCGRRAPSTALDAAADAGLLDRGAGRVLRRGLAAGDPRAQRRSCWCTDKAEDQLPHQGTALVAVGRAMGYPAGSIPARWSTTIGGPPGGPAGRRGRLLRAV